MFAVQNKTPLVAKLLPAVDGGGREVVLLIAKGTYSIIETGRVQLAPVQEALTLADEYYGDPETLSIRYASDIVPEKCGTDVAMIGHAYALRGLAREMEVGLEAGPLQKVLRITGDRCWEKNWMGGISASKPKPFEQMPLVYERAFGGVDTTHKDEAKWFVEARNPVGRGVVANSRREDLATVPLPNIEDPQNLIRHWKDRPEPAGFGFVAPAWQTRCQHAGTYDEAWRAKRFPLLPKDFNPRFYNGAPPGLTSTEFFRGGEPIRIVNASRKGTLAFELPRLSVMVTFYIDGKVTTRNCVLDTVVIEPDKERVMMTWRAQFDCHKKLKYVTGAKVSLTESNS